MSTPGEGGSVTCEGLRIGDDLIKRKKGRLLEKNG